METKAIIFDCFGVLLANTQDKWVEQLRHRSEEDVHTYLALTHAADKGIISEEEATRERAALLGISSEDLANGFATGEVPNMELIAHIRELKKVYKVGLLSNIYSKDRIAIRFPDGLLDELFDAIVISGDLGVVKPVAGIYEYAAAKLGVAPEACIMIDDIEAYCEGARAVGMQAIQFSTTAQALSDLNTLLDETAVTV